MVVSINALFLNEVVDCRAQARAPTDLERAHVAQRIWSDGGARQSGTAWDALATSSRARVDSMRAADLALSGLPDADLGLSTIRPN